jgi:hypothetical protein
MSALKHRLLLLTLILVFLMSPSVFADTLSGTLEFKPLIENEGFDIYLSMKSQPHPLKIVAANPSIKSDLRRLKAGDFIIAQGSIAGSDSVTLDAIESVGLQKLLGSWHTADWQIYEFRDFNRLLLYRIEKPHPARASRFAGPREYRYVLAPETGSRFSIFLSDNTDVHAGSLELLDGRLTITVFNNETGDIAENISLSPLPVH